MKKTIGDLDIKGKRVLMRVDFNVPLDAKQHITDDTRIRSALPTIKYAIKSPSKVILMSHLGRPKGEADARMSLAPCAKRLSRLLGKNVKMLRDCVGSEIENTVRNMRDGDVVLLENLRFHKGETKNDPEFAGALAKSGDIFINDAFGTCHRAHASTQGVTKFLPGAMGFLVEKEINYFEKILHNPERPFALLLGGAKVSDKIAVIENMLKKIDYLLIGGAMAYTFLKSRLKGTGNSRLEEDKINMASDIFAKARNNNVSVFLPGDHVIARAVTANTGVRVVREHIPDGWIGLDIGPRTIKKYKSAIRDAKTIFWNGPLGYFELRPFRRGTADIARFISRLNATTVIGGGDTAAAINALGLSRKMSHISTGGGASLEYLEGKELPGIAALEEK
ncbi:MAG: phosphoglycerate kinase [Candidatus Omnitrophota bacterium]|nr:MAG: phosphoglycerate kinase [Candidatus Omnitrophota bacterium]